MYPSKHIFSYADDYCGVFPRSFEKRDHGKGSIEIADEYIIYFKPETPENIKQRFIKEYAEYNRKRKESGLY